MENLVGTIASDGKLHIRAGINGNVYAFALKRKLVEEAAQKIGKSVASVYYNYRFQVWAIRCRSDKHKRLLLELKRKERSDVPKVSSFDVMKKLAARDDKSIIKMFPLSHNIMEINAGNPKKKKWGFVKIAIDEETATKLLNIALGKDPGIIGGLYVIDRAAFDAAEKELSADAETTT